MAAPRLQDEPVKKSEKETPSQDIKEENGTDKGLMAKRWRNRRRMAWISLLSMFVVTYFVVFTDVVEIERLKVLKEVITWFYFACISVVGAYMGFTTWASKR